MISQVLPTRDGRGLYCRLLGPLDAAPTVVFEADLADTCSYWYPVQTLVSQWVPTVSYDRSGLGLSAADPSPRTLSRMADDLGDLLAQLDGPFILVGQGWGGLIAGLAAAPIPLRVTRLLLVDPPEWAVHHAAVPTTVVPAGHLASAIHTLVTAARSPVPQ